MEHPSILVERLQIAGGLASSRAAWVLATACRVAARFGHRSIVPEHILLALASVERVGGPAWLTALGLDVERQASEITALVRPRAKAPLVGKLEVSSQTERLLDASIAESRLLGHEHVGPEHLVLGLLSCGDCPATRYLQGQGISADAIRRLLRDGSIVPRKPTVTFVNLKPANELADPAGTLDSVPLVRKAIMGFYALISGCFFGLLGIGLVGGAIATGPARGVWTWQTVVIQAVGAGLLTFSVFLLLVWLRLWFGRRAWLDRMINRLFWRVYFILMAGVIVSILTELVIWLRS
jgi:ClpA/ClpB-like protein